MVECRGVSRGVNRGHAVANNAAGRQIVPPDEDAASARGHRVQSESKLAREIRCDAGRGATGLVELGDARPRVTGDAREGSTGHEPRAIERERLDDAVRSGVPGVERGRAAAAVELREVVALGWVEA